MRLLLEVFMIVFLIILVSICYASIVSAAYDDDAPDIQTNQQNQQQQQQLPFCDEDQIQQTNRNAGYLFNREFFIHFIEEEEEEKKLFH